MGAKLSDIGDIILDALNSKEVLQAGADVALEAIPKRTRLGKGVVEAEGAATNLPQLKDKTKYNRGQLKKTGKLTGPGATPAKSGLNATGAMLSGMTAKIAGDNFTINLADDQQEKKAEYLIQQNRGFTFMNISNAELNRVVKAMSDAVAKILSRIDFDSF